MFNFYQTRGGREFVDVTARRIAVALERIAETLEKLERAAARLERLTAEEEGDGPVRG